MRARFAIMDRASGWLASAVQRVSRRAHDTETASHDLGSIDLSTFRRRMSGDCREDAPPVPFAVLTPSPFCDFSENAGVEPGLLAQVAPLDRLSGRAISALGRVDRRDRRLRGILRRGGITARSNA